jgi:hypothetical protein
MIAPTARGRLRPQLVLVGAGHAHAHARVAPLGRAGERGEGAEHDARELERLVTAPVEEDEGRRVRERADLVVDGRAEPSEELFDAPEVRVRRRLEEAEAERLRQRRLGAVEHRVTARDLRPARADPGLHGGARLHGIQAAPALGALQPPRQAQVREDERRFVSHAFNKY